MSIDTWSRQKGLLGQGSVSIDTWGGQKSSLGRGSLLATTPGVDRKAPWDEALC